MTSGPWLFDRRTDLWTFGGSAALSLAALGLGMALGVADAPLSPLVFVLVVVLLDVAHVWSTLFRTYLDPTALAERPLLYTFTPLFAWVAGVALYQAGEVTFWRVFAYVAVFHFIRQQYGFLALYRARAGERRFRWVDTVAIYSATIYPLVYWHTHLPRNFDWFLDGDFVSLPAWLDLPCRVFYIGALATYVARTLYARFRLGQRNPGRDLIVATTAVCWLVGVVLCNGDFAFTVTNVPIHGIPYIVLIRRNALTHGDRNGAAWRFLRWGWLPYLVAIAALSYGEEWAWDRTVWHDNPGIFGGSLSGTDFWHPYLPYLVPLLAVPQLTHYLLDGFIWKRRAAPGLHAQP